jgi:predicted Zn-dependent peptidase
MRRAFAAALVIACCTVAVATHNVAAQAPDRSHPPATGAPPALKLPAIQKRQLSNSLPVWIVELHKVPVVQVNLVVLSGSGDDPAGKFGVANLTASLLLEGAGSRSALEIADAVDYLGADLVANAGSDGSAVRLHVPVARLADALPIMADVALRPTFPNDELRRLRAERLTNVLQARDDPETIGQLAFARVLYGTTHRYGTAQAGSAATIRAFTVDDVRSFYSAAYRPDNAALIVVGDVSADRVVPMLETHFGGWHAQGTSPQHATLPAAPAPTARQIYIIDKPGAPQSQIRIGAIGVPRSTPDFFPIQVMNTVLGGAFSSRLNLNLREKNGYTYGASSIFDMRMAPGPFVAAAGVQTDKTADALKEFFNELTAISQPIPAEELARAKHYVSLRFPSGFETTGDVSSRLEQALIYHLPDDYFATYVQRIEAVTVADAQRVAQKYIQPNRLAVVIAGDRAAIEPGIRALNVGTITILKVDDVFGPEVRP